MQTYSLFYHSLLFFCTLKFCHHAQYVLLDSTPRENRISGSTESPVLNAFGKLSISCLDGSRLVDLRMEIGLRPASKTKISLKVQNPVSHKCSTRVLCNLAGTPKATGKAKTTQTNCRHSALVSRHWEQSLWITLHKKVPHGISTWCNDGNVWGEHTERIASAWVTLLFVFDSTECKHF